MGAPVIFAPRVLDLWAHTHVHSTHRYHCFDLCYQLEDIWPAPSWASIESGEGARWKVLHYHIKRAYAPLILFADLSGVNVTADKRVVVSNSSVSLQVVSDMMVPFPAMNVTWSLWDWSGTVTSAHSAIVAVPPLSVVTVLESTRLAELLAARSAASTVLVVTAEGLSTTGETSSASTELFLTPFRDMVFPTGEVPTVNVTVVGEPDASTITLSIVSSGMVPLLTLDSESSAGPGYWSDSSFLAFPGRAVVVKYTFWGDAIPLSTFLEDLTVRSSARPIRVYK